MGYQITYGFTGEAKRVDLWKIRIKYLAFGVICVLLLISAAWMFELNWQVTVRAMDEMAETISQGEDFADAFSAFCINVLQGPECG